MLCIPAAAWAAILTHLREAWPEEGCGILFGEEEEAMRTVRWVVPCPNTAPGDRRRRFQIDPERILLASRQARVQGLLLHGFYHSHPGFDAYFSPADLAEAWPAVSNLVVSLEDGICRKVASFRVNRDRTAAEPEPLVFPADPSPKG
jgi:proteasome lid subunit RPN8/RPN11